MSRAAAIAAAETYFDEGGFAADLARRVAIPTESQVDGSLPVLQAYLGDEIAPTLQRLGFESRIFDNPVRGGPILIAERREDGAATTVLGYGHGDVIRGLEPQWRDGLNPWALNRQGDRLYGRGTADNKGQHSVNLGALECVLKTRGRLGFNSILLLETGEEIGSPGLREICRNEKDRLAADVLIASDGPRLAPDRPTIFLGARGAMNFDLVCDLREGGHHSGNWGGLLSNPGVIMAHALASITSDKGAIKIKEWKPASMPNSVRMALADCTVEGGEDAPEIDPDWGEPGLSPSEKVFGWCSFEVLAFTTGNPENPVNAIPPKATATCQIRFVVGVDPEEFMPALRRHLDGAGFPMVRVEPWKKAYFPGLEKLTSLWLDGANVSDLRPLRSLKDLKYLYLDSTQVRDLTPLEDLKNLISLDLDNTAVEELSPIANLANLRHLRIRNTQVTDTSMLGNHVVISR